MTALPAASSELTLVELPDVLEVDFVFVPEAVSVPLSDAVPEVVVVWPAVFKSVAEAASVVSADDVDFAVVVCVADAEDAE